MAFEQHRSVSIIPHNLLSVVSTLYSWFAVEINEKHFFFFILDLVKIPGEKNYISYFGIVF